MTAPISIPRPRPGTTPLVGLALVAVGIDLALTTGYIHLTLGGQLFTLNAIGFFGFAGLLAVSALPHPIVRRFAWVPRVALAAYTLVTIGAYLAMGPYFTLGWVAKAVEVGLLIVIAADLGRLYGSPNGVLRAVSGSLRAA